MNTMPSSERPAVWETHHLPFLQAAEFLLGAMALGALGRLLMSMDISSVFGYFVWALAICVLIPLLGLRRTTLTLNRQDNTLAVVWQPWWGGKPDCSRHSLDAIRAIALRDMRKTYRNGEDIVHGVTLHNWQLWADLGGDNRVPLTPPGQGSGLFDRRFGERTAEAIGVPFGKEVWELPK